MFIGVLEITIHLKPKMGYAAKSVGKLTGHP